MAAPGGIGRRDRIAALLLVGLLLAGGGLLLARGWIVGDAPATTRAPRPHRDAVLFDRFAARRERSDEGDRLSVTLRLRTSAAVSLPCFVFLVARSEQSSPRRWAAWPPQALGSAVSAGGHFHGATPSAGFPVTLSETWERVSATLPQPPDGESYDTVIVYVVDPAGRILLARPFRV